MAPSHPSVHRFFINHQVFQIVLPTQTGQSIYLFFPTLRCDLHGTELSLQDGNSTLPWLSIFCRLLEKEDSHTSKIGESTRRTTDLFLASISVIHFWVNNLQPHPCMGIFEYRYWCSWDSTTFNNPRSLNRTQRFSRLWDALRASLWGNPWKPCNWISQKMKLTRYSNSFFFFVSVRWVVDTPDRNSLKESPNFLGSFYESYPSTSTIQCRMMLYAMFFEQ